MSTNDGRRYQLRIQARIEELRSNGAGQWYPTGSGGLEISDTVELMASNFFELAGVLAQFHQLGETLRQERAERLVGQ